MSDIGAYGETGTPRLYQGVKGVIKYSLSPISGRTQSKSSFNQVMSSALISIFLFKTALIGDSQLPSLTSKGMNLITCSNANTETHLNTDRLSI
jgi:hypothetical protein